MKFGKTELHPFAQVVVLIVLLAVCTLFLSIILLPSYIEFLARNHQREAQDNLQKIYKAEAGYFEKNKRYADSFAELGCAPGGGYTYYLGTGVYDSDSKPHPLPGNVKTWANKTEFQAVAVENLDEDVDLDVWTVNEKGRFAHVFNDFTRSRYRDYPSELRQVLKKK